MSEGLKELLEEAQEYLKDADDEILEPYLIRRLADALSAQPAPGHTDLMVTPETLDAFMEANPLPTPDWREAVHVALETCAIRLDTRVDAAKPVNGSVTIGVGFAVEITSTMRRAMQLLFPAPQPGADIERLERIADHFEHVAHIARLNALDAEAGKNIPQEVSADYGKRAAASYREQATDHEANAAAIRSAISSQTSPQGKQGVRMSLARLGSQEATPNTGVKLEGGGG